MLPNYVGRYTKCTYNIWKNRLLKLCGSSVKFVIDAYGATAWLDNKQVGAYHKSGYGQVM